MFAFDGLFFLLCIWGTAATSLSAVLFSAVTQSTCPARTVNYITHSSPQQCLTSAKSSNTKQASTYDDITSTTLTDYSTDPVSSQVTATKPVSEPSISSAPSWSSSAQKDEELVEEPITSTTTVVATSISSTIPLPVHPAVIDEDSALESGNFLSFEDWKKQNLIKAGQSEHVGKDANLEQQEPRKRPSVDQNSLDSLGDDVEIDLDFSGLVPGGIQKEDGPSIQTAHAALLQEDITTSSQPNARKRSKDAGTTCKERFNYASFDCAANILKNNPQAKNPRSVLIENKDAYMLNECSAKNKFLILELCDDLLIDTIVLANFEYFSSIFREVRVSVSDRYPVKVEKWKTLGTFEARNTREVQAFLVENPVIWARYLRIEFLTHFGNEYYCPVSLVRVHGTTMLEEYKHDLEMSLGEGDEDDDVEVAIAEGKEVDTLVPEAVDEVLITKAEEVVEDTQDHLATQIREDLDTEFAQAYVQPSEDSADSEHLLEKCSTPTCSVAETDSSILFTTSLPVCPAHDKEANMEKVGQVGDSGHIRPAQSLVSYNLPNVSKTTSHESTPQSILTRSASSVEIDPRQSSTKHSTSTNRPSNTPSANPSSPPVVLPNTARNVTSSVGHGRSSSSTVTERKSAGSATQSHPASPTMQESFFKSVQKRLQMLESNSSLSLQYIEEQSRSLRDAFRKVEQRQFSKTSTFLDQLNLTVSSELREFRQQYNHLWQSTVIELEMQREQYQRENSAMHARLGVLADELIFQKRIAILQMSLILVCLGLVLFSRGVIHNYLELPLVQSVLSKSPSRRWMNLSTDTTSNAPQLERVRSAHQLRTKSSILKAHNRGHSNDSDTAPSEPMSPSSIHSPPTPVSYDELSDLEPYKDDIMINTNLDFDPNTIERPSTSPPIFPGSEGPYTPPRSIDIEPDSIDARLLRTPHSSADRTRPEFKVKIDEPTPRSKHLKWELPDS